MYASTFSSNFESFYTPAPSSSSFSTIVRRANNTSSSSKRDEKGKGSQGKANFCLCSPSTHMGAFRCHLHRAIPSSPSPCPSPSKKTLHNTPIAPSPSPSPSSSSSSSSQSSLILNPTGPTVASFNGNPLLRLGRPPRPPPSIEKSSKPALLPSRAPMPKGGLEDCYHTLWMNSSTP